MGTALCHRAVGMEMQSTQVTEGPGGLTAGNIVKEMAVTCSFYLSGVTAIF